MSCCLERETRERESDNGGFWHGPPRGRRLVPLEAHCRDESDGGGSVANGTDDKEGWLDENRTLSKLKLEKKMMIYMCCF